ncbi:hypothetical protein Lal_00035412 [Lupinus albus]|nr:hypothetical protein Lal_00035412 [Lupinus albus]
MVHNTQDAMLYNAHDALLPIPLDEDIITLGGAICTSVAWPVHLVDVIPTKGMVIDEIVP